MFNLLALAVVIATLACGLACFFLLWRAFERDEERVKKINKADAPSTESRESTEQQVGTKIIQIRLSDNPSLEVVDAAITVADSGLAAVDIQEALKSYDAVREQFVQQHRQAMRGYMEARAVLEQYKADVAPAKVVFATGQNTSAVVASDEATQDIASWVNRIIDKRTKVSRRDKSMYGGAPA